ncbi:MAG: GHKL domain-containing protein, partial [Lachnospiraceae bacterium]|nr:GHKL domain-containing protein [Lachnospiraceae bacterium]
SILHYGILMYLLQAIFLEFKSPWNKKTYFLCSMLSFVVLKYLPYFIPGVNYNRPYWYFFFITLPLSLLTAHICLKGPFFQKTLYVSFYVAFIQLGKVVFSPLYSLEHKIPDSLYQFWDVFAFTILIVLLLLLAKLFINSSLNIDISIIKPSFYMVLYLPVSLLLYYWIGLFHLPFYEAYKESILGLIILPSIPLIYNFFYTFLQYLDEQRRLDQALTETKAQVFRYRYSLELDERIKIERHELKNNYLYIQTLLNEKEYDKLSNYLDETIGKKMQNLSAISTGNTMIDYMLNRKIVEASHHDIKVYTEVLLPAELPINDDEFCTIFLNLFNNALEACQDVETPDIHITIKCVKSYLSCEITNKANTEILELNPDLQTTKSDKSSHGLGLKIVKKTIAANDGIFHTSIVGNYFHAKFMIPMKENL